MGSSIPSPRSEGFQALREGKVDQAIDLLGRAAAADEQDAEARAFLGVAYSQKGLHAEAAQALRAAVELQPQDARFRFNLGAVLERAGDAPGAVQAYRDTLAVEPGHAQAQARVQALGAAAGNGGAAGLRRRVPGTHPPATGIHGGGHHRLPSHPAGDPAGGQHSAHLPASGAHAGGHHRLYSPVTHGQGTPHHTTPSPFAGSSNTPSSPQASAATAAPTATSNGQPSTGAGVGGGLHKLSRPDNAAPPSTSSGVAPQVGTGLQTIGRQDSGGQPAGGTDAAGLRRRAPGSSTPKLGPRGTVACPHCGQWSRAGMSCEWCSKSLKG